MHASCLTRSLELTTCAIHHSEREKNENICWRWNKKWAKIRGRKIFTPSPSAFTPEWGSYLWKEFNTTCPQTYTQGWKHTHTEKRYLGEWKQTRGSEEWGHTDQTLRTSTAFSNTQTRSINQRSSCQPINRLCDHCFWSRGQKRSSPLRGLLAEANVVDAVLISA